MEACPPVTHRLERQTTNIEDWAVVIDRDAHDQRWAEIMIMIALIGPEFRFESGLPACTDLPERPATSERTGVTMPVPNQEDGTPRRSTPSILPREVGRRLGIESPIRSRT